MGLSHHMRDSRRDFSQIQQKGFSPRADNLSEKGQGAGSMPLGWVFRKPSFYLFIFTDNSAGLYLFLAALGLRCFL